MRRLKSVKRPDWRAWIGSPTAWLALLLSAGNAFYSIFYFSDELTIIVQDDAAAYHKEGGKVSVYAPNGVVFVNSGTRPVAITEVTLSYSQPLVGDECDGGGNFNLDFPQTVIKPGDIITLSPISFRRNGLPPAHVSDVVSIDISEANASKVEDGYVIVCASVTYIVENTELFNYSLKIAKVYISDGVSGASGRADFGPITLLKRNVLWTDVAADVESRESKPIREPKV
ncbi:hypothetical protein [Rhizobium leguminosarum]|uniref:hypothetical protein n=1 Tax=Rhizobium leguminosarum TaxID=384 RepID=UPI003F999D15